jgi:hypothetical protein
MVYNNVHGTRCAIAIIMLTVSMGIAISMIDAALVNFFT